MVEIVAHFVPTRSGEIKRYQQVQEKLRDNLRRYAIANRGDCHRILHGWGDGRRYEVGGYHDCDGATRDALTVNAFWVLADMLDADVSLRPHVLAAFQRLDSPFGFKTFAPGFGPDAVGVGRINRLPIGAAENGAVYLHATAFAIAALFRMGEAKRAWQQIAKILPFAPHHKHVSHSPFVMPNSYVHNPQLNLNGQSMNDWQTGASNVLLKLLVRYVVGFQPDFEHLRIAPAAWMPFDGFEFGIVVRNKKLRIAFRRADVASRNFIFNGVAVTESIDEDNMSTINLRYETFRERVENRLEIIDSIRIG